MPNNKAQMRVQEQRKWIEECGGDLAGYLQKYGSAHDAHFSGAGGEAIYAADMDQLRRLEERCR